MSTLKHQLKTRNGLILQIGLLIALALGQSGSLVSAASPSPTRSATAANISAPAVQQQVEASSIVPVVDAAPPLIPTAPRNPNGVDPASRPARSTRSRLMSTATAGPTLAIPSATPSPSPTAASPTPPA